VPYVTEISLFSAAFIAAYVYLEPAWRRGGGPARLRRVLRWMRTRVAPRRP
jgi:hypothetical protein